MGRICLALDLGAESGRAIAGIFDGARLTLRELHRFPNTPIQRDGALYWDFPALVDNVKRGIARAALLYGADLASIGVDSWGVDYALADKRGRISELPRHYRDARTEGIQDGLIRRFGWRWLYDQTGAQMMGINTLYQLLAEPPERIREASRLLFIPDAINYILTGVQCAERTVASTSQCYDARARDWAYPLLDAVGLPIRIFPDIRDAGETLGPLTEAVAEETGAHAAVVALTGAHDTTCAVAATPAEGDNWAFLSSGTWSLLGVETDAPVMSERAAAMALGNEVGAMGTFRPLKNIAGLWLAQQCRAAWAERGREFSYEELTALAAEAPPFAALIDPDDPCFLRAGDMPARVAAACERSGSAPPASPGGVMRVILESLALRYRATLDDIEAATGRATDTLHVVGGGARNALLNQFTANAIGRPVVAGPFEATSAGNILLQLLALGDLSSLRQGRQIIRDSFPTTSHLPEDAVQWGQAYDRFRALTG